ncbi:coat protein [Silene caulimovirus A]|nr:coat protein [Silene caulimovirus A]
MSSIDTILWKHINSVPEALAEKMVNVLSMSEEERYREIDHNVNLNKELKEWIPEWTISDSISETLSIVDFSMMLNDDNKSEETSESSHEEEEVPSESDLDSIRFENLEMNRDQPQSSNRPFRRPTKRPKPEPDSYPAYGRATNIKDDFGDKRSSSGILNIDCANSDNLRKEQIDKWAAEISLVFLTNPEVYTNSENAGEARLAFIEHKTLGSVNNFIKNTQWRDLGGDLMENVIGAIYTMFLGLDYASSRSQTIEKERVDARRRLINLQLCDICFLQPFFCDYEANLYKLPQNEYPGLIKQYLAKIPIVGKDATKRFESEATNVTSYSLAFAQKLIKEELSKICEATKKQKKLKKFNKKCCPAFEKPFEYGCKISYSKKKKKYPQRYKKKRFKKKYTFKSKRSKFRPGKYFKPRKREDKSSTCPKGKKSCKCWICNVEGHYANECPNRQIANDKVKLIEIAERKNLVPIEDIYKDEQEVFYLELVESSSEEEEDSDTESFEFSDESE